MGEAEVRIVQVKRSGEGPLTTWELIRSIQRCCDRQAQEQVGCTARRLQACHAVGFSVHTHD